MRSKRIIYVVLVIVFMAFSFEVLAQSSFVGNLDNLPGYVTDLGWLFRLLGSLACYLFQFAVIALGVMLIVFGIMAIKGMGNPQSVSNVKTALTWGVVGGMVIFGVITIILSVIDFVGVTNYPNILNMLRCNLS